MNPALFMTSGNVIDAAALQAVLALSTVDLFQNPVTPSKNSLVGDFTVANFSGYAQQVITTVPAPIIDPVNGGISLILPSGLFVFTTGVDINTIYGWFLRTAGGVLVAAGTFSTPISMQQAMDAIPLSIVLNFTP